MQAGQPSPLNPQRAGSIIPSMPLQNRTALYYGFLRLQDPMNIPIWGSFSRRAWNIGRPLKAHLHIIYMVSCAGSFCICATRAFIQCWFSGIKGIVVGAEESLLPPNPSTPGLGLYVRSGWVSRTSGLAAIDFIAVLMVVTICFGFIATILVPIILGEPLSDARSNSLAGIAGSIITLITIYIREKLKDENPTNSRPIERKKDSEGDP